MRRWAFGILAFLAAAPAASLAQTESRHAARLDSLIKAASAPSQLFTLFQQERSRLVKIMRETQRYDSVSTVIRDLAGRLATRFSAEEVAPGQRVWIARLLEESGERKRAAELAKATETEPMAVVERVELLMILLRDAIGDHDAREVIAARIDSLGDSARIGQLAVHGDLYYSTWHSDIREHLRRQRHHAERAVAAAIALGPDSTQTVRWFGIGEMVANLVTRLRANGDGAAADSVRDWGLAALEPFGRRVTHGLRAMKVVGTAFTSLPATHWLNAPPGFTSYDPRGKVTLVMMTSHW